MNETPTASADSEPTAAPSSQIPGPFCSSNVAANFEDNVRRHPFTAILLGAGLGFAAVLIARAFAPPPRHPAIRLLEDIQHRISGVTMPVYHRAETMAQDGAHSVARGISALHLDNGLDRLGRGFRSLFH